MHRVRELSPPFTTLPRPRRGFISVVAACAAAFGLTQSAKAGSATFDFGTDPASIPGIAISGNNDQTWQPSGGNPGGFLALTYSQNSQNSQVIFPDIDAGKLVKAFKFEADLRIGNAQGNGGRPADGFSVSFARGNDPILADPSTLVYGNYAGGAPENGATTGIAVNFDTWAGNALPDASDLEGIIVRVDNVTVNRTALNTRNGACDNTDSLQTGPYRQDYWDGGGDPRDPEAWAQLCWQPFSIELDEVGKLTVTWKGRKILDQYQTTYFPSVSRLVLAGRTGDANEATHFDNVRITTVLADGPIVGLPTGSACGFTIPIADAGTITPVQSTIVMKINGTTVTPSISRAGDITTLGFNQPAGTGYASGSTNVVEITFTDTNQKASTQVRNFIVPAYTTLPASAATTQFTASSSGFLARIHQIDRARGPGDANLIVNAEQQLVAGGGYYGPDGQPLPNIAIPGPNSGLYEVPIVNWDQAAGNAGNFTASSDPAVPDELIPGMSDSTDNIAAEILTYIDLPQGCTTFGVNSDDGFTVRLGHTPFGPLLGSFNGGRGAADTQFRVFAPTAGVYPIRLSWWEGGGGANVEFFSFDATGKRHLVNDRSDSLALKAYSAGRTSGNLVSFNPYPGYQGVEPQATISAVFKNDLTSVVNSSIRLIVDGQQVTTTPTTSGDSVTVSYRPTAPMAFGSTHTNVIFYTIGTTAMSNIVTFTVRGLGVQDLGSGFVIEAEDFDFDSGQTKPEASAMPYLGGAYLDLAAVNNVDYAQNADEPSGAVYRTGESPNVPMYRAMDANTLDVQRPGYEVTENYAIGWAGAGDWYNYTRTFPAGTYKVVGAQSYGDVAVGDPNRHILRFGIVTGGKGTSSQQTVTLGNYSTGASGGWGANTLSVLQLNGEDAVFKVPAGTYTFRVWIDSGDFDWFAFVPTSSNAPAASVTATPATGTASAANLAINISDLFRNASVAPSGVKLMVNGQDVTANAAVTDTPGGISLNYSPSGGVVDYEVIFTDSAGSTQTYTGRFTSIRSTGNFVIEAEDFNYDSGKSVAAASTMPLAANLYSGLAPAVPEVDYHVIGNEQDSGAQELRTGETPNVPINRNDGVGGDRGTFTLSSNYKIGWIDSGEWFNFTRNFPSNTYNVFVGISHGGGETDQTAGSLQLVTSGATTATQTTQELGIFRQVGASGGWGVNRLLPLVGTNNALVKVTLNGTQTVRYTATSGDYDYLLFTPAVSIPEDVTAPGDVITRVGGSNPGAEAVENAIDNAGQKYLNFGVPDGNTATPFEGPIGLIVTPAKGSSTVTGIRIFTANDATARDPKNFTIEGSNDGTTFSPIYAGQFDLPTQRNAGGTNLFIGGWGQTLWFPNTTAYKTYRVMFQSVRDNASANSMQFAEMELLGTLSGGTVDPNQPQISVSRAGANINITWTNGGSLEASPVVGTGAVWTTVDSDGSYTTTAQGAKMFFRVRK